MARIYTRAGDDGSSGLIGGKRVSKDSPRLETYGTVDELNALLGRAIAETVSPRLTPMLKCIQNRLFDIGAELAMEGEPIPARIQVDSIQQLEGWIDDLSDALPPLTQFILPGGGLSASTLHIARTVCRRAERRVVSLRKSEPVNAEIVRFLNRLSDLLFVMARFQNLEEGKGEELWEG